MDEDTLAYPQVMLVQLGARRHYAVARILDGAGLLHRLVTDAYGGLGSWLQVLRYLPGQVRNKPTIRRVLERTAEIPSSRVDAHNVLGLKHTLQRRYAKSFAQKTRIHLDVGKRIGNRVKKTDIESADAVYGIIWASRSVFSRFRDQGKATLLDQMLATVSVEDEIIRHEHQRWGDLVPVRPEANLREAIEHEQEEHRLATTILAPSRFVANSLAKSGVPSEKIRVVPYGIPQIGIEPRVRRLDENRPLRLLFVGGVTPRKGVQYLLEASRKWKRRNVELRLVGPVMFPDSYIREYCDDVEFVGKVPRGDVKLHYEWADAFVFPSLCEGMAAVLCEALQSGLPIVATPNSGAEGIIDEGKNGYLIPIRHSESIVERVGRILECRDRLLYMSENAISKSQHFTIEAYGKRLVRCIEEVV